jgi:arsenate reductase (thioredoxin)
MQVASGRSGPAAVAGQNVSSGTTARRSISLRRSFRPSGSVEPQAGVRFDAGSPHACRDALGAPPNTNEAVKASDVMTTMGCGDTCALYPGKRYEDWALEDPAGKGVDAVRPIRDETRRRVGSR